MSSDSRNQFLTAATTCFANRGFYGTSIAAIVEELPYTKQALLHHFGSKEKLYAEILKGISVRLIDRFNAAAEVSSANNDCIQQLFLDFYRHSFDAPDESQLLMRELLDNTPRAESAQQWYLKPFLEKLTDLVMQHSAKPFNNKTQALAAIYQVLGAINYFIISKTTLEQMFGNETYRALEKAYELELKELVYRRLCV